MRAFASIAVLLTIAGASPAAACSYVRWSDQERTVAFRSFQRDAIARATQIFVAEVVDIRPSTEVAGSVVTYRPMVVVSGPSSLPSPWSETAICELPTTAAKIGDRMVVFAEPDATGVMAPFESFSTREIYISSLRRQVRLALQGRARQ